MIEIKTLAIYSNADISITTLETIMHRIATFIFHLNAGLGTHLQSSATGVELEKSQTTPDSTAPQLTAATTSAIWQQQT